jgi:catechol 2,3-dioxygenase-like lactoylglutathione lyase family enzyme
MIDHIYLPVSDLNRSSEFYKKVLEPLGIDMPYKFDQPPIRGFAINTILAPVLARDPVYRFARRALVFLR